MEGTCGPKLEKREKEEQKDGVSSMAGFRKNRNLSLLLSGGLSEW